MKTTNGRAISRLIASSRLDERTLREWESQGLIGRSPPRASPRCLPCGERLPRARARAQRGLDRLDRGLRRAMRGIRRGANLLRNFNTDVVARVRAAHQ